MRAALFLTIALLFGACNDEGTRGCADAQRDAKRILGCATNCTQIHNDGEDTWVCGCDEVPMIAVMCPMEESRGCLAVTIVPMGMLPAEKCR